jgi:hypothetical protein
MGMVIPPTVTHNVNIILPRELRKTAFYLVSMWNFTKDLAKYVTGEMTYGSKRRRKKRVQDGLTHSPITLDDMTRAKLDTVLLIIMNGNDVSCPFLVLLHFYGFSSSYLSCNHSTSRKYVELAVVLTLSLAPT